MERVWRSVGTVHVEAQEAVQKGGEFCLREMSSPSVSGAPAVSMVPDAMDLVQPLLEKIGDFRGAGSAEAHKD